MPLTVVLGGKTFVVASIAKYYELVDLLSRRSGRGEK